MKRLLLYIGVCIALLYGVRELLYIGIRSNAGGEFDKLNISFRFKHETDVLIVGSSRAECQLYPPILEKFLGARVYNIGMTGATLPLVTRCYEAFRENSPAPKQVILLADIHSLGDRPDSIYHYPRYFPYLSNAKLYEGLSELDPRFRGFKWNAAYSLAHLSDKYRNAAIRGFTGKKSKYDYQYKDGYSPCEAVMSDSTFFSLRPYTYPKSLPEHFTAALQELAELCRKDGAPLIVLLAPVHTSYTKQLPGYEARIAELQVLCDQLQISCGNPVSSGNMQDRRLYADPAHYNVKGALLYSIYAAKYLDTLTQ